MKKVIALLLVLMMVLSFAACGAKKTGPKNGDKYIIGVCQFMPHVALDAATQGFKDAVEAGLGKDKVEVQIKDAAGEVSNCNSIVSAFKAADVDLIMANATPALTAAANATPIIPILGTSITEYGVALDMKNFNGVTGRNISGTSDLANLADQAQMIIDWCPDAKNIGLLYCNAEANSQYQVDEVQKYLEGKGLTCKQFSFADTSDLNAVTQKAAEWSDAIYLPTDNTVANNAAAIDQICLPAGVPIIAGEQGICAGCGIATLSIDYYDLGYATGEMAVRILKNGEDISKMAIEYTPSDKVARLYNPAKCEALGITPLEGYEPLS